MEALSLKQLLFVGADCMAKWKNLVDQFRKKYDKSGSAGTPIADRVIQWRFYDRLSFMKEYIVNRRCCIMMNIY